MSAENGVVWRLGTRCEYMSAVIRPFSALMYSQSVGSAQIARDSAPMHRKGALDCGASTRTSPSGGVRRVRRNGHVT